MSLGNPLASRRDRMSAQSEAGALHPVIALVSRYWWVELLVGVFWVIIALVILKFNHASVTTVGILIGIMFLIFSAEQLVLFAVDPGATRWLWLFFGILLGAGGIVSLIHPRNTFAGFADILGFVFLVIGVLWLIQAFGESSYNPLWWLGLIAGGLLVILAFYVSGEFFLNKAATLLVFAGIWALVKGITDIVRAFQLRAVAPA